MKFQNTGDKEKIHKVSEDGRVGEEFSFKSL